MKSLFLLLLFVKATFAAPPIQKIAIISDLNGSYGSTEYGKEVKTAISALTQIKPNLVLSTGDMVAGQKPGLNYRAMWSSFHDIVTLPLQRAGIPFAVTVGNHDGSGYAKYAEERSIFIDEWKKFIPDVHFSDSEHFPVFYSFEMGGSLFISIDSTQVGPLSLIQLSWLEKELKKHTDKKNKIIFTHVPMFHFANVNPNESFFDQQLMNLIKEYKVNLYLTGHHHTYYPGFYEGTHFVSQACVGAGPETLNGMSERSAKSVTFIDFYEDHFEIYALKAPNFKEKVDHKILPKELSTQHGTLLLKDHSAI